MFEEVFKTPGTRQKALSQEKGKEGEALKIKQVRGKKSYQGLYYLTGQPGAGDLPEDAVSSLKMSTQFQNDVGDPL